ncbi:MAG: hypothetical protein AAGE96_03170 [Cyanobacteria bacterium P01_G01_bin.19]
MGSSHFPNQLELPAYNLSAKRVTRFLLSVIAILIILNLSERFFIRWLNATNGTELISRYFNFDQESNLPTLYSALTLGFCSYLLAIITTLRKAQNARYIKHWKGLSIIFSLMAIDEMCSYHELLIPILREALNAEGIFYFTWVIPGFFLVGIFLISYRKFIFNLPPKTRNLFILAGAVYLSGTLGMEMVGGYLADRSGYNTVYGLASTTEELFEMFGIVIFINGLLSYIQSQLNELHLSLRFKSRSNKASL